MSEDVSHETPDVTPCRTSSSRPRKPRAQQQTIHKATITTHKHKQTKTKDLLFPPIPARSAGSDLLLAGLIARPPAATPACQHRHNRTNTNMTDNNDDEHTTHDINNNMCTTLNNTIILMVIVRLTTPAPEFLPIILISARMKVFLALYQAS